MGPGDFAVPVTIGSGPAEQWAPGSPEPGVDCDGAPASTTGGGEWRRHWPLALAGAIGYSTTGLHTYTIGAMVEPLQREFDWSRAYVTLGMTITGVVGAVMGIPVGILVDRIGARRVGLAGVAATTAAFALLGTATGTGANWMLLWGVFAVASLGIQASMWTSAIAASFDKSRGLALDSTLSGGSLAAIAIPLLTALLIPWVGWRHTFMVLGALWAILVLPLMFVGFRGTRHQGVQGVASPPPADLPGIEVGRALRSATFYKLLLAAGLFTFTVLGAVVNFVPILQDRGAAPISAAGTASLIGLFSIAGRLGTGVLLDRFAGHRVGAVSFILPAVGFALLLADGGSAVAQAVTAASLGLTLGAETDVIAYLAARHFGMRNLGVLFGALTGALALGSALGPLTASAIFDQYATYTPFLTLTVGLLVLSALCLASLNGEPLWKRALQR